MNKVWFLLIFFMVSGCATPATVKQAVKKQSEAYTELQETLREFNQRYVELNEHLFRLNQDSRSRIEALAMVHKLSGLSLDPEVNKLNPLSEVEKQKVEGIATKLDSIPTSRKELLEEINKSIKFLEEAFKHGETESQKSVRSIRETLQKANDSHANALKEIRALLVIHDTAGEYLDIDLTPESMAFKEAITNIKSLKK